MSKEPKENGKRKISAATLVADIRSGMDYESITAKHNISPHSFDALSKKLVEMGQLEPSQLPNPKSSFKGETETAWRCPACNMPQDREFNECPQCGVIVNKYVQFQSEKEKTERARKLREEQRRSTEEAKTHEKTMQQRIVSQTVTTLKDEYETIPDDFKKKLYPGLTILVRIGNACAFVIPLVLIIGGIIAFFVGTRVAKGDSFGIAALVGSLFLAAGMWLVYKTYAEGIQILVDVASSLTRANHLLGEISDKLEKPR